ncbi:hypothetical protein [Rhizobium sp. AN69]|uniref:hypothetical protein n=1 Tax=Rhizobium sp. AN69 TaxID=3035213 RepID=UPI002B263B2C|nr:hypothetical protein [Rhizobium sp. AN69]
MDFRLDYAATIIDASALEIGLDPASAESVPQPVFDGYCPVYRSVTFLFSAVDTCVLRNFNSIAAGCTVRVSLALTFGD